MSTSYRSSWNVHGIGSWLRATRWSFTVIDAPRAIAWGLEAATIVRSEAPRPLTGVIWIHEASLAAVHEHSRAAFTVAVNVAPAAGTAPGGNATLV
jgi:hypothetical protein